MKLFITGGTGFFGRALLRNLLSGESCYDHVTVLTRNPESFISSYPDIAKSPLLSFIKGDVLASHRSWQGASNSFDHIIHAATESGISHELNPMLLTRQIVQGTERLLEYAEKCDAERLLYISSGAAYGAVPEGQLITETMHTAPDTLNPRSCYGNAKRLAENLCFSEANRIGLECVVARCFSFVGCDMAINNHFALGSFLKSIEKGVDIVIDSNGRSVRSYLDQGDLARALLLLLAKGAPGQIYNVGSDEQITILRLAELIREISATNVDIKVAGGNNIGFAPKWYVPDVSKLEGELGFRRRGSLTSSLSRIIGQSALRNQRPR